MIKPAPVLAVVLSVLAACGPAPVVAAPAPAPVVKVQGLLGPMPATISAAPTTGEPAASTASANPYCLAGVDCMSDASCGPGMKCINTHCAAPCKIDGQCLHVLELESMCGPAGVCIVEGSGALWCPAPCTAGDSCTSDADCGPMAPHCDLPPGEKGACERPCKDAGDCGAGSECLNGTCRDLAGGLSC